MADLKTKTTPVTKELTLITNVDAIKITTIKKSFVKQMPRLNHKEFTMQVKDGTIKALGLVRSTDDQNVIVLQMFDDGKLITYTEINYREHLAYIARFDHDLKAEAIMEFVEFGINKIPQLFTT